MHSGEAAQTLKEDVSLEDGTLAARRTKTRKARIAKLWPRTVDAIREYLKLRNDQSEYLFVTQNGTPMSGEVMRQSVVRLRRCLELPEYVTFEGLRDAGYTIADEVDSERATWIGGHPKGQKDRYILRQANTPRIRKCCEAIEKHFFGGKK
jgi:integrase